MKVAVSCARDMGGPWILIVDDDEDLGAVVEEALVGEGWPAVHVTTAAEALARLDYEPPAVCIIDWHLPGEDSAVLIGVLRDRDVPFILSSGWTGTVERAAAVGASGVLPKPYGIEALLHTVEDIVRPASRRPQVYS